MEMKNNVNGALTYEELLSQKQKLSEELLQCKQDKEFVWKLWKEMQGENPSTTNIINSVIEREQEKSDAKDLKVLMIFEQKDKQIKILQEVSTDLQTQVNILNERVSEQLSEIGDLRKGSKDIENEKIQLKNELDYKEELLKTKEKQLLLAESSRNDLEDKIKEQCILAEKSTNEVEEKINELLKDNMFYQETVDTLNEKLEVACKETEDVKTELASKDEELNFVVSKLDDEMKRKLEMVNEYDEKDNEINLLKEAITMKEKECDDISTNLDIQYNQIITSNQTIRELSKQVEVQAEDIQYLNDQVRSYDSYPKKIKEQAQLIQNLEKLQDETQHVLSQQEVTHQQEINTYQNTIYELKVTITKHQNEVARISTESKAVKRNNNKLESICDSLQVRENSLQQELDKVSFELDSLRNKLNLMSIEQAKSEQERLIGKNSQLSSFTQTTPRKFRFVYCENSTQTEDNLLSDESDEVSHKVKRKKEKLHNESQRLLTLKSEINQENRSLKKRILILENQCNQLNDTKSLIEKELDKMHGENKKLKEENGDISQKLVNKTEMLQKRSKELEERSKELQVLSADQVKESVAFANKSSKLKATEEELQVAVTNCSKLSFQLKTLSGENEILMEKQKSFQERILKLERLLNQKKSFIEDLKLKHNEAKCASERKTETIENINVKLKNVTEREGKDKVYIEKLKTKLDNLLQEKSNLQSLVDELKSVAEEKTHLLQETQHVCHKAEAAISAMEYTAAQQIKTEQMVSQRKEAELNSCYTKSNKRINELKLVVKNFTESLLLQIHEKRGNILRTSKEIKPPPKGKENIYKKKACDVACSILNMSAADLEEFMNEDASEDTSLQKFEDNDIREKLDIILGRKDNFEKILTHFLLDLVKYFWSLSNEDMITKN